MITQQREVGVTRGIYTKTIVDIFVACGLLRPYITAKNILIPCMVIKMSNSHLIFPMLEKGTHSTYGIFDIIMIPILGNFPYHCIP